MIDFKAFVKKLINSGLAKPPDIVGCTEEEIRDLESEVGAKLPETYRKFLSTMGHSISGLLVIRPES